MNQIKIYVNVANLKFILRPGNLMLFATSETWRQLNRVNFHKEFWYCYYMGQVKQIGQ